MNTCYSGFNTTGNTCCPPNTTNSYCPPSPFAANCGNTWMNGCGPNFGSTCSPFGSAFPGFTNNFGMPNTGWGFAPTGSYGNFAFDCCGPNGCDGTCTHCWTPMGWMPIASPTSCIPTCACLPNGCTICGFCVNGCFVPTSGPMSNGNFGGCSPTWSNWSNGTMPSWNNCTSNVCSYPNYSSCSTGGFPWSNGWSNCWNGWNNSWNNNCQPTWTNQWSNRFNVSQPWPTNGWSSSPMFSNMNQPCFPGFGFGGFTGCDTNCAPFGWNGFPAFHSFHGQPYCGPMGTTAGTWCGPTNSSCFAPPMNGSWMPNACTPTGSFNTPFNSQFSSSPFGNTCPPTGIPTNSPSAFANTGKPFGGTTPNPANPGASNCGDVCCPPMSRSAA